jgi:hypothetical protein
MAQADERREREGVAQPMDATQELLNMTGTLHVEDFARTLPQQVCVAIVGRSTRVGLSCQSAPELLSVTPVQLRRFANCELRIGTCSNIITLQSVKLYTPYFSTTEYAIFS